MFPVLFFFLALCAPPSASGQTLVRSWLSWRTVETRRFVFHYPVELEEWTRALAARADAIDSSVARIVGFAPPEKTHVVVDDPYDLSNGSAWPFIGGPVISLWATPPDPRNDVGEFRDWGRTLLSHEFTHIAHLARPSRNGRLRLLWSVAPVNLGPLTLDSPRWVIEGFATYAEGKVTGSGRPHGSWRPAYLREWSLEGQLPRYEQLDGFGGFDGGEFAYLAGSAFFEWLAERRGDSSLVAVWRRMTAKQPRGFDEAFTGVFGESARTLYGRFSTELTGKSIEIERGLRAAFPGDTGDVVQRLAWATGDPAISRDGKRVALSVSSPTVPSRIIIWSTAAEPDTGRARRDSLLRASDPEDVPARPIHPPPKRVLASLSVTSGSAYQSPRFLPNGEVLLSRYMPVGDGSLRPDLFIWNPARRSVRRVTHRAAISDADASPDGKSAIGTRCAQGWCDVVLVDLATGADRTLAQGSPQRSYYRPRFAPNGGQFLVSANEDGRWTLRVFTASGHMAPVSLPFRGNAYDGAWVSPNEVVATVDASGIANLEVMRLDDFATRTLTHVTGAAVGAERNPADSSVWFLSLYSRGYDLRRVNMRGRADSSALATEQRLAPAAMTPPVSTRPFDSIAVGPSRRYGLGTRLFRWLPLPEADADGVSAVLALSSGDLIGRSEVVAKIGVGDRAEWRGATIDATWRGFRPFVRLNLFDAAQVTSATRSPAAGAARFDTHMRGALVVLDETHAFDGWSARLRVGASAAELPHDSATSRTVAFADLGFGASQRRGTRTLAESFAGNVSTGQSFDARFTRGVATLGLGAAGFIPYPVSASATYARTNVGAPTYEHISLGGGAPALVDRLLLSQQIVMPALPAYLASGTSAFTYRVTIGAQPVSPFFWAGSAAPAGTRFADWHRVVGLEGVQAVPSITVAGVPPARIVYGGGYSFDAPFRNQVRGYLSVVINP